MLETITRQNTNSFYTIAVNGLLKDWDSGEPEYTRLMLCIDNIEQNPVWQFVQYDSNRIHLVHDAISPTVDYIRRFANENDLGNYVKLPYNIDLIDWSTVEIIRIEIIQEIKTEVVNISG